MKDLIFNFDDLASKSEIKQMIEKIRKLDDKSRLPYIQQFGRCLRIPILGSTSNDGIYWHDFSNLKNKYMDNEKLNNAIKTQRLISQITEQIKLVENTQQVSSITFWGEFVNTVHIDQKFINFKNIKSNILSSMRKELTQLKKEFAKL